MSERIRYGSRGQGSLLKFPNSPHWYTAVRVRGEEVVQTTGTDDLKKARRVHRQRLDEAALDRQGAKVYALPAAKRVTVSERLDAWEKDVKLRALKSADKAIAHSKDVRATFGAWKVVDVTDEAVDRYIERLREAGFAKATVNRRVQCLGSALKKKFRKLSELGNARQGFFELEEVERLAAVLPEHLRDLVWFAYYTGWRKGEIVSLRWSWVDLAAGMITLPDTKNGRPRTVALSGDVLEVVRRREAARLLERDGEPIVTDRVFHRGGKPIGDFKRAWRTALREAGLTGKIFHDLRRTGVRNMVRSGVPEVTAMSISGHKTRSIFDRYSIVSGEDQRAAMEKVSR